MEVCKVSPEPCWKRSRPPASAPAAFKLLLLIISQAQPDGQSWNLPPTAAGLAIIPSQVVSSGLDSAK